ncbi:unnamed protein product, partial [Coccothraustes coccothraustes]
MGTAPGSAGASRPALTGPQTPRAGASSVPRILLEVQDSLAEPLDVLQRQPGPVPAAAFTEKGNAEAAAAPGAAPGCPEGHGAASVPLSGWTRLRQTPGPAAVEPWRAGAQLGDGAVWAQPGPAPVPTQLQPGALGSPRSRSRGVAHGI